MKKTLKTIFAVISIALIICAISLPAFAAENADSTEAVAAQQEVKEEKNEADSTKAKIIASAALIGAVAGIGAIAMGWAITSASRNIARQPEAAGNIRTNVMLGLVFIETAIIYALIVAILVIFVL